MQLSLISSAIAKKTLKVPAKTIILSHKREYNLSLILNISESVETHTSQNDKWVKNYKEHATVFNLNRVNKKMYFNASVDGTVITHTSQNGEWVKILQRTCNCFWFKLWKQKDILKEMVRFLFCHTSDNKVYCLFLHVVETVEKTRKPKCCKSQNNTNTCSFFWFHRNW